MANGLNAKCMGSITRKRQTSKSLEESIIDHVIISHDLIDYLESILIDEEGQHSLMKIIKSKSGILTKKKSDHNTIISNFKFTCKKKKVSNRFEMYNSKNTENQKIFSIKYF